MRAGVIPEYAAVAFAALSRVDELAKDELAYASKVTEEASRYFIAPETKIAPEDQIAFNKSFAHALNLDMPRLTDQQRKTLFDVAATHPAWRILAVPLLDTHARHDLAERARRRLPNEFNPEQSVIRPPDDGTVIRELTQTKGLEGTVSRGGSQYVIRYRASTGQLLSRSSYIADLLTREEAVAGIDGTVWMFLLGDVRTYANDKFPIGLSKDDADERMVQRETDAEFYAKTYQRELLESSMNASELYGTRWPALPPTEALILMNLMHNAAREPNRTYDINLANEAVHEITLDGQVAENPQYLTTIRFRTQDRRIGHYARDNQSKRDYLYVRPFINVFDVATQR
jgi:hypothetical protein